MASHLAGESRHYETIVIGAGISGLATASRLLEHDRYRKKNQLLVLEGRDRIGGRIGEVHIKGCRLDTGANWIHGIGTEDEPNPLVKILPHKKFKQLSGTVAFRPAGNEHHSSSDDEWVHVDAVRPLQNTEKTTDLVIPAKAAKAIMDSLWSMIGSLGGLASQTPADEAKHTSMLQAIVKSEEFQNTYKNLPKEYHHAFSAMPQFIENMEAAPLTAQSAEHAADHPGFSLLEFAIDDFDGDQVFLQDGYIAIVNEIAKHLVASDVIKTSVKVQQIRWNQHPIEVETDHGVYTAKNVICTLPLGILQHAQSGQAGSVQLFQPALPSDKQEAISSLGFGTLDKIFLVYDHAWWTEEPYTSIWEKGLIQRPFDSDNQDPDHHIQRSRSPDSFIGFTNELPGIEINQDGSTSSGIRTVSLINLHNLTRFPVLSGFVSCAVATQIEAMSDDQAGGIMHRALTNWIGREPPKPSAVHVTRWSQDKYSRGSYSHCITGLTETRHRETFQQPIVNDKGATLRFAGEHTSRNHFATVHGALLSGWREADAIMEHKKSGLS